MIPSIDPESDYRALVRRSYDACAEAYDRSRKVEPRIEVQGLSDRLTDSASVLDIGCGTGVPMSKWLAARYWVTGVDVSQEMIRRARENVPSGEFNCDDVMSVEFAPSSFDAAIREISPSLAQSLKQWETGVHTAYRRRLAEQARHRRDDQ